MSLRCSAYKDHQTEASGTKGAPLPTDSQQGLQFYNHKDLGSCKQPEGAWSEVLPSASSKKCSPNDTLILAWGDCGRPLTYRDCDKINLYCFKPICYASNRRPMHSASRSWRSQKLNPLATINIYQAYWKYNHCYHLCVCWDPGPMLVAPTPLSS